MPDSARFGADALDAVVDRIYDAGIDPTQWAAVLEQVADALDSEGTTMYTHDFGRKVVHVDATGQAFRAVRFAPNALASYEQHFAKCNVWVADEDKYMPGEVVSSSMLFPDVELPSTEFFADWLRPQGLFHSIGVTPTKTDSLAVLFTTLRSRKRGPYSDQEMAFLRSLYPHVRRACELNRRLFGLSAKALEDSLGSAALGITHLAMMVLGPGGQLLHANCKAEALLRTSPWLSLSFGRLHATQPQRHAALLAALRRVQTGGRAASLSLGRPTNGEHCFATLMPMPPSFASQFTSLTGDKLLCLIGDGADRRVATCNQLMELFGMSAAESRLARALANGENLDAAAEVQGVTRNTVKTQLQSVMAKTGTDSQRNLIRLVLAVPPARD